jgi:hypothetical protein
MTQPVALLSIGVLVTIGALFLIAFLMRAARRRSIPRVETRRRSGEDHYSPTVGTASAKKTKGKKAKRESFAFHPVPPEEHQANRQRAGLVGETRVRRRRDREKAGSTATGFSSTGSSDSSSYDWSTTAQSGSSTPSYESTPYDSSTDYGSSSSDSSWSSSSDSSSDSSSGGDFGGGGSSDSY